uniref:Uncharacterized protein n=1 Tax=viral metagenome TaxID=1070528 RepID=A0A6C0H9Q4_9ZZZZ
MSVNELKRMLSICGPLYKLLKEVNDAQEDMKRSCADLSEYRQHEDENMEVLSSAHAELESLLNQNLHPSSMELWVARESVNNALLIYNILKDSPVKVDLEKKVIFHKKELASVREEIEKHTQKVRVIFPSCEKPELLLDGSDLLPLDESGLLPVLLKFL